MELGFPKPNMSSLKEQMLRTTLRNVRSQGHPYVELRQEGKKLIFFCTMCLAPCYGDSSLYNHLNGSLHTERLATAQVTLLKQNPWPFNDGVFFFHGDTEEDSKSLPSSNYEQNELVFHHADANSLALVGPLPITQIPQESEDNGDGEGNETPSNLDGNRNGQLLVIPDVLQKNKVSDLVVRPIGVGKIGARFSEKKGVPNEFRKIWCEWLGDADLTSEDNNVIPEHDFAIITFSYNYNLGREGLFDDFLYLLPCSPHSETEDSSCSRGKKRKSFSDPEYTSEALANQNDSSGEESQSSNNKKSKVSFSGNDDQLVLSRVLSSKTVRKQLRKQQRVASERTCDICKQKMLPKKDVAALFNRSTGKLACSSRNFTGAFHLFHVSCLVHWIMLCEVEIYAKQSLKSKGKPKSRRKVKGKKGEKHDVQDKHSCWAYCPECQGTGINIDGDELEKPTVPLSEIFQNKIKLCDARKAWIKDPEILENCSMGFYFPPQSDEISEKSVAQLKLLHFYRADD